MYLIDVCMTYHILSNRTNRNQNPNKIKYIFDKSVYQRFSYLFLVIKEYIHIVKVIQKVLIISFMEYKRIILSEESFDIHEIDN